MYVLIYFIDPFLICFVFSLIFFFQIPNSLQLFQFPTATACSTLPKVGRQIQTLFLYFCRQYFWRYLRSFGGDLTHTRRRRRRKTQNQPSWTRKSFFCLCFLSTFCRRFVDILSTLQKRTIFLGGSCVNVLFCECLFFENVRLVKWCAILFGLFIWL